MNKYRLASMAGLAIVRPADAVPASNPWRHGDWPRLCRSRLCRPRLWRPRRSRLWRSWRADLRGARPRLLLVTQHRVIIGASSAHEDWRSNDWRQQRTNEDWRQREEIAKQRNPNNAVDRGYVEPDQAAKAKTEAKKNPLEKEECGIGALKPSPLCQDRVKDKANNTAADTKKNNETNRGFDRK